MAMRAAKSAAADEIAAIEALMSDLEQRLHRLSASARRETAGASSDLGGFVNQALVDILERVRENASDTTTSVADEATRLGTEAIKKLTNEIEHRPLVMLGIAAGVGFLAGLVNRR